MSLELQISTQQAQANLEAVSATIREFITVTQQLSRGVENIERFTTALNSVRPISAEVVTSVAALAEASAGLAGGAASLDRFAAAMGRLNSGAAGTAAASIEGVARSAASVNGAQIDLVAQGMTRAGQAAGAAVSPMAAAMSATNNFRTSLDSVAQGMSAAGAASATTGAHLGTMARGMTQAGQAAAAGVGQVNNLGAAANNAGGAAGNAGRQFSVFGGIIEAMVFSAAIGGFKSLVEGATEATMAIQKLQIQIDNSTGVAGNGAKAYQHLSDMAFELGIPIKDLTSSFGRFTNAMTAGGHTLEESQRVYDNFALTFRAVGLSGAEMGRAFIAVDQVMQKGKVQSEELVKQLGQSIPAMELLATSMGLVTDEGKPAVAQLQAMMKTGSVSSDVFIKFSEDLRAKYLPAIDEASRTGAAAFGRLETGAFNFLATMGQGIFAGLIGQINAFAAALQAPNGALQSLGYVLGLISGGVGAAFLYVVQSWGTVLGTVAQIFINGAGALAQLAQQVTSFVPQGGALYNVLSSVGTVVGFIVERFGPLATVIGTGALAFGILSGAAARLWGILSSGRALIVAALTNPITQAALVAAAGVAAFVGLGTAIYSLYQTLTNGTSFTENFKNNISALSDVVRGMTQHFINIAPNIVGASTSLGSFGSTASATASSTDGMAKAAGDAASGVTDLANAGQTSLQPLNATAGAAGSVATNTGSAASNVASLSGQLNNSAGAADQAAAAYRRAAAAARELAAAQSGGGGNGGGSYYYGGIPGKGVGQMFHNAKTYAGGGVTPDTSGGIPSILHANEAVVPLRAGGTIPVSLVGLSAPQQSGGAAIDMSPVISVLQQIAQDDVTRDSLIGQSNDKLDLILGQLTTAFPKASEFYMNALNLLNTMLGSFNSFGSKISSGGSSGGYSGGSSGSIGGGTTGTEGEDQTSAFRELQAKLQQLASQRNNKFEDAMANLVTGSVNKPVVDWKFQWARYAESDTAKQNMALDAQAAQLQADFDAQYGAGAYAKQQKSGNKSPLSFGGFATGSPNAWKDITGGFTATLHPNEAVIPLPDGRSVPVQISNNLESDIARNLAQIKMMINAGDRVVSSSTTTQNSAQTNNNSKITFIVQTPDANSFRKSQPQIVADLRGQLQRAQQTSGAVKRFTEDPSKRIVFRQ